MISGCSTRHAPGVVKPILQVLDGDGGLFSYSHIFRFQCYSSLWIFIARGAQ